MKTISPQLALARLQKICSLQEKCISDVLQKLAVWKISEQESQKIVQSLKKDKFIDEERFAVFFVRDKYKINKWGREKIRYALIHRGLASEIIESALSEIKEEKYYDILKEVLIKKMREIKSNSKYELRGKLIRFGIQRGYSFDNVYKLVDEVMKE